MNFFEIDSYFYPFILNIQLGLINTKTYYKDRHFHINLHKNMFRLHHNAEINIARKTCSEMQADLHSRPIKRL